MIRPAVGLLLAGCGEPPGPEPEIPSWPRSWTLEPLEECAAPGPPGFVPVLAEGVEFVHHVPTLAWSDPDDAFLGAIGGGVLADDLDGDGLVDVAFAQADGPVGLYWGLGDFRFEPAAEPVVPGPTLGIWAVDLDANGLKDLVVSGRDRLVLLGQDHPRAFSPLRGAETVPEVVGFIGGMAFADADGNGSIDIYVGGFVRGATMDDGFQPLDAPDLWLSTDPGLGFQRWPAPPPWLDPMGDPESDGACLFATWSDLDNDLDPDLLQWNDFGGMLRPTALWENAGPDGHGGWTWVERGEAEGFGIPRAPMGAAVTDLDGDGRRDLWASNIGPSLVWRGTDTPFRFVDTSLAWGEGVWAAVGESSWSVVPLDPAGDGSRALYLSAGPLPAIHEQMPVGPSGRRDRLVRRAVDAHGDVDFVPWEGWAPEEGNSRGVARADFDRDGVPDLVVARLDGPPAFLRGQCTEAARLVVELRDDLGGDAFAIGAVVTVEAMGMLQQEELRAEGPGTFGGSEGALFFGLGAASQVDRVEVRWRDGTVSRGHGLPVGQRLRARK